MDSAVTAPPMLTPAAQAGSGTRGRVKRTWPARPRCPKRISMTIRMTMTSTPRRRKKARDRDHGRVAPAVGHHEAGHRADQRRRKGLVVRMAQTASPAAQIHQASGCNGPVRVPALVLTLQPVAGAIGSSRGRPGARSPRRSARGAGSAHHPTPDRGPRRWPGPSCPVPVTGRSLGSRRIRRVPVPLVSPDPLVGADVVVEAAVRPEPFAVVAVCTGLGRRLRRARSRPAGLGRALDVSPWWRSVRRPAAAGAGAGAVVAVGAGRAGWWAEAAWWSSACRRWRRSWRRPRGPAPRDCPGRGSGSATPRPGSLDLAGPTLAYCQFCPRCPGSRTSSRTRRAAARQALAGVAGGDVVDVADEARTVRDHRVDRGQRLLITRARRHVRTVRRHGAVAEIDHHRDADVLGRRRRHQFERDQGIGPGRGEHGPRRPEQQRPGDDSSPANERDLMTGWCGPPSNQA